MSTAKRQEIDKLYGEHNPEKLAEVDQLVGKYGEDRLLSMIRRKYGVVEGEGEGEAVVREAAVASAKRNEIDELYGTNNPEKLSDVDKLVGKYGEDRLLSMVRKKYGVKSPEARTEQIPERTAPLTRAQIVQLQRLEEQEVADSSAPTKPLKPSNVLALHRKEEQELSCSVEAKCEVSRPASPQAVDYTIDYIPSKPPPLLPVCAVQACDGSMDEAMESLSRLEKQDAERRARLGAECLDRGNFSKAVGHYKSAVQLDPTNSELKAALELALTRRAEAIEEKTAEAEAAVACGDSNTAAEIFKQAASLDPTDEQLQRGVRFAESMAGKRKLAQVAEHRRACVKPPSTLSHRFCTERLLLFVLPLALQTSSADNLQRRERLHCWGLQGGGDAVRGRAHAGP